MTKERFKEIQKEYGYPDNIIERLWKTAPAGTFTDQSDEEIEEGIRWTNEQMKPRLAEYIRLREKVIANMVNNN